LRLKFPRLFDLAVNKDYTVEEMKRLGGDNGGRLWEWRGRLFAWEEESVGECSVMLHNVVLQETVHDTWRWMLDPIHGYSVWSAYHFITKPSEVVDMSLVDDI